MKTITEVLKQKYCLMIYYHTVTIILLKTFQNRKFRNHEMCHFIFIFMFIIQQQTIINDTRYLELNIYLSINIFTIKNKMIRTLITNNCYIVWNWYRIGHTALHVIKLIEPHIELLGWTAEQHFSKINFGTSLPLFDQHHFTL